MNAVSHDHNTDDAASVALRALGWTLRDEARATRLLGITGLTPEGLRAGIGDSALLAAVLRFLEGHEADLIACAEMLDLPPRRLVAAREVLER